MNIYDNNVVLAHTEHATTKDPRMNKTVLVESYEYKKSVDGIATRVPDKIRTEVCAKVVGITTNTYVEPEVKSFWPWKRQQESKRYAHSIFAVQLSDGSFRRVAEEEIVIVYNVGTTCSENGSKPKSKETKKPSVKSRKAKVAAKK